MSNLFAIDVNGGAPDFDVQTLQNSLEENPYQFDTFSFLLRCLRQTNKKVELNIARQRMLQYHPLGEGNRH